MIVTSIVTGIVIAKLRSSGFLKFRKPEDTRTNCMTSLPSVSSSEEIGQAPSVPGSGFLPGKA